MTGSALAAAFAVLPDRAGRMGVSLPAGAASLLLRHFEAVLAKNEVMNLTRIVDPEEAVRKLYLGSLAALPALVEMEIDPGGIFRAADVGSGAGFPGIPLAAALPHVEWTLLDSRRRKAEFLAETIREIGLENAVALHARAEELPFVRPDLAKAFELVVVRAVGSAAESVAVGARLLRRGGTLVVYKGPGLSAAEIEEGRKTAVGFGLQYLGAVDVPVEDLSPRLLLYARK